jgi:NADPH-dependent ferric siderophore reductase
VGNSENQAGTAAGPIPGTTGQVADTVGPIPGAAGQVAGTAGAGEGRPRRRKPARRVEVVSVSRLTPRLVSVRLAGEALQGFRIEAPTSHIKVFLPAPGQVAPILPEDTPGGASDEASRPVVRTYTPRRFDEATGTLEVQFVLHGVGPASEWAERAAIGDQIAVAGPGGRFSLDETVRHWWIAGDESALPAVATLLEALPAAATAEVHLEVAGPDDEIEFSHPAKTSITWHHRRAADAWGVELDQAARSAVLADGTRLWVACEAAAVRGIRKHFLAARQVPASSVVTRGYWRLGVNNHPDHDYGDDDLDPR